MPIQESFEFRLQAADVAVFLILLDPRRRRGRVQGHLVDLDRDLFRLFFLNMSWYGDLTQFLGTTWCLPPINCEDNDDNNDVPMKKK